MCVYVCVHNDPIVFEVSKSLKLYEQLFFPVPQVAPREMLAPLTTHDKSRERE